MLSIIAGKPGSGKSYHMASIVVDMLTDWMRYELKEGKAYDSTIWTNMKFNIEGLNETISKRLGKEVDVEHYMVYCDNDFFQDPYEVYWWKKFPGKSLIIIDEVHFLLGKKVEYGSLDMEQELINWISTHRHSQQEIYFLSQHTEQFANQILGIADKLLEIVNFKSMDFPFPLSFSASDLEVVKRAFGINTQYYQANVGNFRGKAVKWSGSAQKYLMSADVFRAYKSASHGSAEESGDRPDLKMSPIEALLWFGRKHAWHLVPKIGVILSVPFIGYWMLTAMPLMLADAVTGTTVVEQVEQEEPKNGQVHTTGNANEGRITPPAEEARGIPPPPTREAFSGRRIDDFDSQPGGGVTTAVTRHERITREVKVVMLYEKGVILDDGKKLTIGEEVEIDGKTETLAVACPRCGVIVFGSGKRLRL